MKLPIKFRGNRIDSGEVVYGELVTNSVGDNFIIDEQFVWNTVKPDSVTQLVGVDKDGNEIYADDLDVEKTARKMVEDLAAFVKENHLTAIIAVGDGGFANGSLTQTSAKIANLIYRIAGVFDQPPVTAAVNIAIALASCKVGEHESDIATARAAIKLVRKAIDAIELTVVGFAHEEVSRSD